jgi:hypothetical protein
MCLTWRPSVSRRDRKAGRIDLLTTSSSAEAGHKPGESVVCTGKIKHVGSTYINEWKFLKSLLPHDRVKEAKITLPAPEWYHLRYQSGRAYPKEVYANDVEYFKDIAIAYQVELKTLYEAGCRNVTIDDPNLACKSALGLSFWLVRTDIRARLLLRKDARRLQRTRRRCRRPAR